MQIRRGYYTPRPVDLESGHVSRVRQRMLHTARNERFRTNTLTGESLNPTREDDHSADVRSLDLPRQRGITSAVYVVRKCQGQQYSPSALWINEIR